MKKTWLVVAMLLACAAGTAQAQTSIRVRGTIAGFEGQTLNVHSREGNDVRVIVDDKTRIGLVSALSMKDVKTGGFVGVTAVRRTTDGVMIAREVHVIPESSRGLGEGHREWDLEPGSTMTNANVDLAVEGNDGKQLTLSYKGGRQKILVPPGTPIVTSIGAEKSVLKAGAFTFVIAAQAEDGILHAQYVSVGRDGLKPPM